MSQQELLKKVISHLTTLLSSGVTRLRLHVVFSLPVNNGSISKNIALLTVVC